MARRRRKNKRKWVFRLFFLVLLITAIIVCYFVWDGYFKDKKDKDRPMTHDESSVVVDEEKKEDKEDAESVVIEKEEAVQYDGEDPNEGRSLSGVITYAGLTDSKLMIRINIDQYLTDGVCELKLIRGGTVVFNDSAGIVGSASTATCEGFDVTASGLGSGKLQIEIKISAGGKTGLISGEVEV